MATRWASTWSATPEPGAEAPYSREPFKSGYTAPVSYRPEWGSSSYDPSFGKYRSVYDPIGSFGTKAIQAEMGKWLAEEAARLGYTDWTGSTPVGVGAIGKNVNGAKFGHFTDEHDANILAAAQKWGIPANFMKAIIAHESQGIITEMRIHPLRGEWLIPYTGIFLSAARSWGVSEADFRASLTNHALHMDIMARGLRGLYDSIKQQNPSYDWINVAAKWYSGDPTGSYTPGDSTQYGTTRQYMDKVRRWWQGLDEDAGNQHSTGGPTATSPGGTEWQPINRWDNYVNEAAAAYGVPANLIKAVMRVENPQGSPTAVSHAGATGLMQVMPNIHGLSGGQLLDARTNIMKGTEVLRNYYRQHGSWEQALRYYHGIGHDGFTSDTQYRDKVLQYWNQLNAAGGQTIGQPTGQNPPQLTAGTSMLNAIWGDIPGARLSQEHGRTAFSAANPGMYQYSYAVLGYLGHPGIDVAFPVGTPIYTPLVGEVVIAGGSGSYRNHPNYDTKDSGEIRLLLSNGDEIIFGHMSAINVRVGQIVPAGTMVGLSGYPTAPHLHLEVRVNGKAVDPRDYFSGNFSGWLQTGEGTRFAQQTAMPMTYHDMLRATSMGTEYRLGGVGAGALPTSWNEFLQVGMRGSGDWASTLQQMRNFGDSGALTEMAKQVYSGVFASPSVGRETWGGQGAGTSWATP